ncbi:hypothetical protein S83_065846, partial [Arachis hypogaea]
DLIGGGTKSSSTTVEWPMLKLLKNSEIIKNAIEELDRVIGRERWRPSKLGKSNQISTRKVFDFLKISKSVD